MGPEGVSEAGSEAQGADVATRWVDAFNRRDADALVALADPGIELSPTLLAGGRKVYVGHDGLRQWVRDLDAARAVHTVRVAEVRSCPSGGVVVVGHVLLGDDPMSSFTLRLRLSDGRVAEGHAYLSDDELLLELGLTDA